MFIVSKNRSLLRVQYSNAFVASDGEIDLLTPEELLRRRATSGVSRGTFQKGVEKLKSSVRGAKHRRDLAVMFDPNGLRAR